MVKSYLSKSGCISMSDKLSSHNEVNLEHYAWKMSTKKENLNGSGDHLKNLLWVCLVVPLKIDSNEF